MKQVSRSLDFINPPLAYLITYIQANVVLQEAAHRVVNENRDLRKLLHLQGFSDQDIMAKLSMLRTTGTAGALSATTQSEFCVAPRSAFDSSQSVSADSYESLLRDEVLIDTPPYGEKYPDQLNAIYVPPGVDSLWDLASEVNFSAITSLQPLPENVYTPITSDSSPSEMDICCSSFLPRSTVPSPDPGTTDGSSSLLLSTPSEAASSINVTGDKSSSTPCTVAYTLLAALNSRRHQQQNMLFIILELLDGFRVAPEGDPEGCRVDNNVLIPVIGKLVA
jgi:hypothetical protein